MSFSELTTEERLVGIEDADDLMADLAQALDRAFGD